MSSYVESSLTRGEQVIYYATLSIASVMPTLCGGFLVAVVPSFVFGSIFWISVLAGVLILAIAFIRLYTTELAITNKRVIAKTGLVSRRTMEINLQKIESIRVDQSVFGRLFDFGRVVVAGAGTPAAVFSGISDPMAFRRTFLEAQEQLGKMHRQPPDSSGPGADWQGWR